MVLLNLTKGEAGARVAFADKSVTGIALCAEDIGTDNAMTDIWFGAKALDTSSIGAEDSEVVQHRRLLNERCVDIHLRMKGGKRQRLIRHTTAVNEQDVA